MKFKWKFYKNEVTGEIYLYSVTLLSFWGCEVRLHKIVQPDPRAQFHSHPATAIRFVLKGGYVEEVHHPDRPWVVGDMRRWPPFSIGVVKPELTHRIHGLPNGPSYSLWIRGPRRKPTYLRGLGWPKHLRNKGV